MVVGSIERGNYIDKYGWCRLLSNNIETILEYSKKIVELGAGSGYIRWLLKEKDSNTTIDSYDIKSNDTSNTFQSDWNQQIWEKEVLVGDHSVLDNYDQSFDLLLIWPPPNNDLAINSIHKFKGNKLIYIGEPRNGMCATSSFFDELNKNWTLVHREPVNSFDNFKDNLFIFKRLPCDSESNVNEERVLINELTKEENCERSIKLNLDDIDTLLQSKDIEEVYEANEKLVSCFKDLFSMVSLSATVRDELNTLLKQRSKKLDKAMMNKIGFDEDPFSTEGCLDLNRPHQFLPDNCVLCSHTRSLTSNPNNIFKAFNRYGKIIVKCNHCNIENIDIGKWVCSNLNCYNNGNNIPLSKESKYKCINNHHNKN
ncbi:hypothetical protein DICPUDRAFT_77966 [Dictyostelium purpureum]|uniref:Methyltransferase domain-containing protein n=1 Tax=Dictyostelium purpureum TaxID=5786 RepID=F0ZI57_DICPU|nr:uncharacterized protein DICPUDRAFT_77966 [Dictyostelium purpureum]EGC36347.1 hypothetical protein DICPUDRAFT_77966 [Dictyostelium purpureum]|eukprot:XP_003287101.1 hypothetical protein DICPUDRAFT_77966 [Dictyostelium purpureum]